jgi:predicted CXXCH cytochrome family protein
MARVRSSALIVAALFAGAASIGLALAEESAGLTPLPAIPKGKGDHCVRPVDFMRRCHMVMLLRQRDETVHEGVRGDFNIEGCVNCHAVKGADGQPVSYADPRHFCRSCHSYASVSIDCFECHASKPEPQKTAEIPAPADDRDLAALNDFVREGRR